LVGKKRRFAGLKEKLARKSKKKKKLETVPVTVQAGCRDMINESFRLVRSNIDFILKRVDGQKVLMMTSFNPGSGKSFITFNLAASFAIKGKKVLIIDCDLRHGSSSQFVGMPSKGISSYLTGNTKDWRGLVVEVKDTPGMYVMPIGTSSAEPRRASGQRRDRHTGRGGRRRVRLRVPGLPADRCRGRHADIGEIRRADHLCGPRRIA